MKDAEYFAHSAVGSTKLKAAETLTARGFWAKEVDPSRKPLIPTDAMRQGSLVDCLITCPEEFDEKYVLTPMDAPKRPTSAQLNAKKPSEATIEAIQFWQDFDAEIGVREVISHEWFINAIQITEVLAKDSVIGPILAMERQSQVPHFWTDPAYGLRCKYKPDLEPSDGSLLDLKKGATAKPSLFERQAYGLGYDIQLDHYGKGFADLHGKPPTRLGFVVYEWRHPHDCALIIADDAYRQLGRERRDSAIQKMLEYERTGLYPSYGECVITRPKFTLAGGSAADVGEFDPSAEIELF
jgi:exodeoxyribonuclease VIII